MSNHVNRWCVAASLLAFLFVISGCDRGVIQEKSREVKQSTSTDVKRDGTVVEKETKTTTTNPGEPR